MQTTTTDLATDLRTALTESRLSAWSAARIANLLPDAGQDALLTCFRDNPDFGFAMLAHLHRDTLAEHLRITTADAETIQALFPAGVQR